MEFSLELVLESECFQFQFLHLLDMFMVQL